MVPCLSFDIYGTRGSEEVWRRLQSYHTRRKPRKRRQIFKGRVDSSTHYVAVVCIKVLMVVSQYILESGNFWHPLANSMPNLSETFH